MDEDRIRELRRLEEALSYHFGDIGLLDESLTHRSHSHENPRSKERNNERLEFLGDAVLSLCIGRMLMERFPSETEGQLSKKRAALVNEVPLSDLAGKLGLGEYLLLGRGEEASGGRLKASILADALEAVLAAVFLDGGYDRADRFIRTLFGPLLEEEGIYLRFKDFKSELQELSHTRFQATPSYALTAESGPDHEKLFESRVTIAGIVTASGTGRNRKEAEQRAAMRALKILEE
jgi:ribonuclease III